MHAKCACARSVHLLDILDIFKNKKHQIQLYNAINMLPIVHVAVEAIMTSNFLGEREI